MKEWKVLKEWAIVVNALEKGEQCVLFRKGGILDAGFSVESSEFMLFPTFAHQTKDYLRDDYKERFEELRLQGNAKSVTITSAGKVVNVRETSDKEKIRKLNKYHVYNDDFIDYRMEWNPEKPMTILFVRTYFLDNPLTIDILPEYSGCRSWIRLNASSSLGKPVFNDKEFDDLMQEAEALIA
ncbi:MAG: DUF1802 family protein [Nitrososphaerales archaeon]